ncbi:MAG TPA: four helix bundle protein [Fimbriimonadaceae bacterium]|nr:four helix bundle protein [Fimbriimonadaceae bacterium]
MSETYPLHNRGRAGDVVDTTVPRRRRLRKHVPIEHLDFFIQFEEVSDWIWSQVTQWPVFEQQTIGQQVVRAADSIGSNLAEGDGRYGKQEAIQYFRIARASARETRNWLNKIARRGLCDTTSVQENIDKLTLATRLLNNLITYRIETDVKSLNIQEVVSAYGEVEDPFAELIS